MHAYNNGNKFHKTEIVKEYNSVSVNIQEGRKK